MTETFEAGQKVRHPHYAEDGEVKFGPYQKAGTHLTGYYLVDFGDDSLSELRGAFLSAIPETPQFSVGDVVTLATRAGKKATVEYGPFDDGDIYVVKLVEAPEHAYDPQTFTAMAHVMTKVVEPEPIKVGDRVRVLAASYAEWTHGKMATVREADAGDVFDGIPHPFYVDFGGGATVYASAVERVEGENTYTHDGVTYDLTAKYRDLDGDTLQIRVVDGVARAAWFGEEVNESSRTLADAVRRYGPLTRV